MVLSEPFLSDITQINFNIVAMVCGQGLPIEVSNHQFNLPAVFVEIWPFRATSFRRPKPGHREGPIGPMPVCNECPLRVISRRIAASS